MGRPMPQHLLLEAMTLDWSMAKAIQWCIQARCGWTACLPWTEALDSLSSLCHHSATMGKKSTFDWLTVLDLDQALVNCHKDVLGDWHRDPWGWPELDWVLKSEGVRLVRGRLNSNGVRPVARIDVAKENFCIRPAIVMDPIDRLIYQALTDRVSKELQTDLAPWVFGWRLARRDPRSGHFMNQSSEWDGFRKRLSVLADLLPMALKTDITSFFHSVDIARLIDDHDCFRTGIPADRLADMLVGFDAVAYRSGLAQRSAASATLANAVLSPLDRGLAQFSGLRGIAKTMVPDGAVVRWMDDVWVFGRRSGALRKAQVEIQKLLESSGFQMNTAKTSLLEGDELTHEAKQVNHSAVDADLRADEPSSDSLDELIDALVRAPERASRTTIRFATVRMRKFNHLEREDELAEVAHRMPQGADHLARLFRASGKWHEMQDWYAKYAVSSWGCIDWSVAQFGTMFPSKEKPNEDVIDTFATWLSGGTTSSILRFSLAAERLTAWLGKSAQDGLDEASHRADHPLYRRVLGLAFNSAGASRSAVRAILGEFEENLATREMLEARDFARVPVKRDFSGS